MALEISCVKSLSDLPPEMCGIVVRAIPWTVLVQGESGIRKLC